MKKKFLILFLFFSASVMRSQSISVRGLYVDGFNSIIGNVAAEDSLLTFARNNDFNYLALYDLWQVHTAHDLTSVGSSSILANFISKAKQYYGILQVGAVGENYFFFNSVINVYNQQHSNPLEKVDVYNVEFEFWNTSSVSTGNYYCTTYLQPAGLSCDTAGAFSYYRVLLHNVDSLANANGAMSETYVGWFNQGQAFVIAASVDRILLHDYISNYSSLYSYIKPRLQYIGNRNVNTTVLPIFSSEPAFMGPWLSTHTTWQPYNDLQSYLLAETGAWKQYIDLAGYQWFDFSNMPVNLFATGISTAEKEECQLYPNPAGTAITMNAGALEITEIQIRDTRGNCLFLQKNNGQSLIQLNVSGLTPGVYFCIIKTETVQFTKKLVILR